MMLRAVMLFWMLLLLGLGSLATAQPSEAPPQPPRVHNGWKTAEGGTRILLENKERGALSGYAVTSTGRKSWEISGQVSPDGQLELTRFVPKTEWTTAPDEVKEEAIRRLGGSRKPGFIESPMQLTLSADGKSLRGTYSREEIQYSDTQLVDVIRRVEPLQFVQITDLLEALMWTAIAMGLIGGLLSMGLDFIPVIGDVKGLMESLTGRDAVTGEELAGWERALGALPLLGGALGTGAAVARLAKRGGPLADMLGDMLRRLRSGERTLDSLSDVGRRGDDVAAAARHADDLSDAARLARQRCFVAGTPVLMADSSLCPIERLAVGNEVLAVTGGAESPAAGMPAARKIVAVHRSEAAALLRISVSRAGQAVVIECTPRHPFATADGYVSASKLTPDAKLVCSNGSLATVDSIETVGGPREVFNLTVEQDHCYFVSALGLLVHNVCPALSQRQFEHALDEADGFARVTDEFGNPLPREAAFKNNESLGFGPLDRMPNDERAALYRQAQQSGIDVDGWYLKDFEDPDNARAIMDRLGYSDRAIEETIASGNFKAVQKDAKRAIAQEWRQAVTGSTRADDLRYWNNPDTGQTELVAFELKTPDGRPGATMGDFIRQKNQELYDQVSQRRANLQSYDGQPVQHDLVIDLRNTSTTPEQAMDELRYMFEHNRNNPNLRNPNQSGNIVAIEDFYKRVRFVVDDAGGVNITPPFATRP